MSLRQETYAGLGWSVIERFGLQGSQFIIGIVLARLLSPEEFGLVAMVMVFVAVGTTITDAGFSQAVIQKKNLSDTDLSTAFYLNIAIGAVVSGLVYLSAPWIAHFYRDSELVDILKFLSVAIFFSSLGQVHRSQLVRELKFKLSVLATLPATLIGGAITIVLALSGWGVWALVMNVLLVGAFRSVFFWFATGWRPTWVFSRRSLEEMLPFGSRLAAAGVLNSIFSNIYVLVIGRFFPPADVGFYQRASAFKRMASENLNSIVSRVLFPTFSKIQSDPERMRRVFVKAFSMLALVFFPIMGLMAGVAHPLIETLIGAKWLPSAPLLQLMCISGALYPLHAINLNVIKALGHSDKFLKIEIIKKALTVAVLFITVPLGVRAVIIGAVACSWLALWINSYYTRLLLDIGYKAQLKPLLVPIGIGLVAYQSSSLVVWISSEQWVLPQLLLSLAVGGSVVAACYYWMRHMMEEEIRLFARKSSLIRRGYHWLYGKQVV